MAPGRLAELVPASVCSYLRVEIVQITAKKMGDSVPDLGVGKIRLQCAAGPNVASTLYYSRLLHHPLSTHFESRVHSFVGNARTEGSPREWAQSIIQWR